MASALLVVGCVGFQNWLVFFSAQVLEIEFVKLSRFRWLYPFLVKSDFAKL